jgi:hypothetical protein
MRKILQMIKVSVRCINIMVDVKAAAILTANGEIQGLLAKGYFKSVDIVRHPQSSNVIWNHLEEIKKIFIH